MFFSFSTPPTFLMWEKRQFNSWAHRLYQFLRTIIHNCEHVSDRNHRAIISSSRILYKNFRMYVVICLIIFLCLCIIQVKRHTFWETFMWRRSTFAFFTFCKLVYKQAVQSRIIYFVSNSVRRFIFPDFFRLKLTTVAYRVLSDFIPYFIFQINRTSKRILACDKAHSGA